MQNFCEILNDISKVDLRKCSSISSLVDPIARSQDFSIECFYCGNQVIGPEYRADIRQVHKIISEFQNTGKITTPKPQLRVGSSVSGPPVRPRDQKCRSFFEFYELFQTTLIHIVLFLQLQCPFYHVLDPSILQHQSPHLHQAQKEARSPSWNAVYATSPSLQLALIQDTLELYQF